MKLKKILARVTNGMLGRHQITDKKTAVSEQEKQHMEKKMAMLDAGYRKQKI